MAAHLFTHGVNQIERALNGDGPCDVNRNPRGAKYRADAAFAQARSIQATFGIAMAEIEILKETSLRNIDVGIDNQRIKMKFACAARDFVYGRALGGRNSISIGWRSRLHGVRGLHRLPRVLQPNSQPTID
jgi:hypothetical protein